MTALNKQALRQTAEKDQEHGVFNMDIHSQTVLALLDELEAKDSTIAAQQQEIRMLLNALEEKPCPKCNDTGMTDSGGTQPWGEPIEIECACRAAMLQSGNSPAVPDGWKVEAERLAEIYGCSFVVFRHGEEPQCSDPTKVIISFTDEGLGHHSAAPQQEVGK